MKIERVEDLPMGWCSACLQQLKDNRKVLPHVLTLEGTSVLWAGGHCHHRNVAAICCVIPGEPIRWTLVTDTEADEVEGMMLVARANFVGVLVATSNPDQPPAATH